MNSKHLPALAAALAIAITACSPTTGATTDALARGRYLVQTMACTDCHSPHGADGKPLPGRELSGHPTDAPLPNWTPAMLENNGLAMIAPTGTAFAGPFGLSVAGNLTPDLETGIGRMTADQLVRSWKTGKHWSIDRPVLPPMPVPALANLEESDIRAIHTYLMSLPALRNAVPASVPAKG